MRGVEIRPFRNEDLNAVCQLIIDSIDDAYPVVYAPEAIDFFKDYHKKENILNDAAAGYTIIAEHKKKIIGTGTLMEHNIRRVYITPKYQRKGIGKLITHELERIATTKGIPSLDLSATVGSVKFWEKMGFEVKDYFLRPVENGQTLRFCEMVKKYGM
jgi:N-acetylglutamate synthase-like GNAT family acetyltransferase